jgi:hypothetical protein
MMALRTALLAAAGAASIAYLALRRKTPPHLTRHLEVAGLDAQVANWLPKLPYLGYIRLCADHQPLLRISGNHRQVFVQLPATSTGDRDLRSEFRQVAARLGLHVVEPEHPAGEPYWEIPAEHEALSRVLHALLREVFRLDATSRLQAEVPGRHPRSQS